MPSFSFVFVVSDFPTQIYELNKSHLDSHTTPKTGIYPRNLGPETIFGAATPVSPSSKQLAGGPAAG